MARILRQHGPDDRERSTRTSRAWAATSIGLAALLVVVVFALQNLKDVEVSFLSLNGELPLAALLLLVALLGALIVFAFGAARIIQLRLQARRLSREFSRHDKNDLNHKVAKKD